MRIILDKIRYLIFSNKFTTHFIALYHFRATEKNVYNNKMVQLTKTVNTFTLKSLIGESGVNLIKHFWHKLTCAFFVS